MESKSASEASLPGFEWQADRRIVRQQAAESRQEVVFLTVLSIKGDFWAYFSAKVRIFQ
jgi:hypothetical protein